MKRLSEEGTPHMVVFRVPQHSEQVAVLVLVLLALRVLPCVALRWLCVRSMCSGRAEY